MPQNPGRDKGFGVKPFCLGLFKIFFSILNKPNLTYVVATSDFFGKFVTFAKIMKKLDFSWKIMIFNRSWNFDLAQSMHLFHPKNNFLFEKRKYSKVSEKKFYAFFSKKWFFSSKNNKNNTLAKYAIFGIWHIPTYFAVGQGQPRPNGCHFFGKGGWFTKIGSGWYLADFRPVEYSTGPKMARKHNSKCQICLFFKFHKNRSECDKISNRGAKRF